MIMEFLIAIWTVALCLLIRNFSVFRFTQQLNERSYKIVINYLDSCGDYLTDDESKKYKYLHSIWDSIMNISYTRMLFSFKPLTPEYWLTEEQQDFLNINKF